MNLTDLLAILEKEEKKEATEEEFRAAAEEVKTIKVMNTEQQLLLYALYKQATVGDVNTSKPSFLDFTGSSKWTAWKNYEGLSKEKALVGYVYVVNQYLAGNMNL